MSGRIFTKLAAACFTTWTTLRTMRIRVFIKARARDFNQKAVKMGSKNNITICPACGQKIVEYKHGLNRTLISCLWHLHNTGGQAQLDKMDLDNTQFTNFQKLRYFGLAVSVGQHNEWLLTAAGKEFLRGRGRVSRFVITRNARVIRQSDERVFVQEESRIAWSSALLGRNKPPSRYSLTKGETNENPDRPEFGSPRPRPVRQRKS
jgi:hypothetical protein